jgi:hypothetical protein
VTASWKESCSDLMSEVSTADYLVLHFEFYFVSSMVTPMAHRFLALLEMQ